MTSPLKLLFEAINQTRSEHDLRSQLAPKIGEYFAATRSGVFLFDQLLAVGAASLLKNRELQKVLNVALSIERNPIARYIAERHTPVHEGLVTSPRTWAIICPRPDHWHVMAGPIIDRGQLVGAVGCTREKSMPAFDTQNLADLSAICLHVSVRATAMRSRSVSKGKSQHQPFKTDSRWDGKADCLTPRELQIAELVAQGQTNAEIGIELWITENSVKQALKRMFRKVQVSSRAEMVAQLSATQPPFLSAKLASFNSVLNADQ